MNFKNLISILILINFFYCSSYNLDEVISAIYKDDAKIVGEAMDQEDFDIDQIMKLIDCETQSVTYHTFLTYAINISSIKVVKLLIAKHADVNKLCSYKGRQFSPLFIANHVLRKDGKLHEKNEIIDLLKKNGAV